MAPCSLQPGIANCPFAHMIESVEILQIIVRRHKLCVLSGEFSSVEQLGKALVHVSLPGVRLGRMERASQWHGSNSNRGVGSISHIIPPPSSIPSPELSSPWHQRIISFSCSRFDLDVYGLRLRWWCRLATISWNILVFGFLFESPPRSCASIKSAPSVFCLLAYCPAFDWPLSDCTLAKCFRSQNPSCSSSLMCG